MLKTLFKYFKIFMITILILFFIQNLVIRIPHRFVEKNISESLDYYNNVNDIQSVINSNSFFAESLSIHYYSDCITLNMINNMDNSSPFKSQVLMNYYYGVGNTMCESLNTSVIHNVEAKNEYSRYWHGSVIFLRPLLTFMNVRTIKVILGILFFTLIAYLIYLILKKSPLLAVFFSVSLVCSMFYLVPMSFEYYFAFLISIIASIIVMRNLNREDEFYYKLFTIIGVCACFFDFLAYEVLTIMFPLFFKVYFDNYRNENIDFKNNFVFIIKCSLLWGCSYLTTFVFKWILSAIILGPTQFLEIWNSAKVRIYDTPHNKFYMFLQALMRIASMVFPFSLFKKAPIFFIIYILFILYIYCCFIPKEKRKFLFLLFIISSIGLLRIMVLFAHSWGHYFFDYRNLCPFIMWSLIVIYEVIFCKRRGE